MSKEKFKPGVANISSYLLAFEVGDLVNTNFLIIQHNLRAHYPIVVVYNSNNVVATPDSVTWLDENRIKLDLTTANVPLAGIWHARVIRD